GSAYTVLKSFTGGDGANPRQGGLLLSDATLYGTTGAGGISNCGVVFSLVLSPTIHKSPQSRTAEAGSAISFSARAEGFPPITYEWVFNATNLLCSGTNSLLLLTNVQPSQAGAYTVVVTNLFGASTSTPAMLSVIPPVPRKMVPAISLTGDVGSVLHPSYADALGRGADWQALDAVTLTATPQFYPDLTHPLPSARFYRAWQTNVPSVQPVLEASLATELTLTGAIASKVRVDYINQYGPTDAWMTLDTVAMTNTTQPYFDFTMFRQPARLYRLVPVP
ncbi:MAG: immunoglobulin domain-containing protein, partial [Verrucomicrobia bacterium]|nr:immunoglobulin domain-containing protein [Verrucomicrobiota bacterium]